MSRTILVEGKTTFRIKIEEGDKLTFGPWSPPNDKARYESEAGKRGTLRVYRGSKENIVACFSDVLSFRDLSIEYEEKVAEEIGSVIWKSDATGYERNEKVEHKADFVNVDKLPKARALPAPPPFKVGAKKRKVGEF